MSYGMDGWCKEIPGGDLISRAEAIDDLHGKDPSQIWDTADIEVWVNALPSAQPERKKGKWEEYTRVLIPEPINKWEQAWYCSECGYGDQDCEDGSAWLEWKYCPNCGARMENCDEQ